MPFSVPTLQTILGRIKADFRSVLGVDPQMATVEYALVRAEAAQSKGQYAYGAYIKAQSFLDTADEPHFWRWAAVWQVYQLPATCWSGTYRFTGTTGTPIPAGTELSRSDGQLYITNNAVTIAGGSVDVAIAGKPGYEGALNSNDPDQPLTLSTPIAGVDSEGKVLGTTIDGADLESQAQGLTRLLSVIQSNAPSGGAGDYVAWAREVPGVTRAWEYVAGPGSVAVSFVRDNDGPGIAILPEPAETEQVRAHVQSKAPVTVTIEVAALAPVIVNFTMSVTPNTADVHAAVNMELADFFLREAEPGATLDISRINAAISAAAGETSHTLISPIANIVTAPTEMAILGTVTFV